MKLHIEVDFDPTALIWYGQQPTDSIVGAYNDYYSRYPEDAFEIALQDSRYTITKARIE